MMNQRRCSLYQCDDCKHAVIFQAFSATVQCFLQKEKKNERIWHTSFSFHVLCNNFLSVAHISFPLKKRKDLSFYSFLSSKSSATLFIFMCFLNIAVLILAEVCLWNSQTNAWQFHHILHSVHIESYLVTSLWPEDACLDIFSGKEK